MEKADIERLVEYYTKKLTDFEAKYGIPWTKSKYANPPTEPGTYYDFSMKMHGAYMYRQDKDLAAFQKLLEQHEKSTVKELKKPVQKFESFDVSPLLFASLSGFNGLTGKKTETPDEFYKVWLAKRINKKKPTMQVIVQEAQNKKIEVMKVINMFFLAREKKKAQAQPFPKISNSPIASFSTQERLIAPIKNQSKKYQLVQCERCGGWGEGYYTLSLLTKGLYVKCKKCGNHAREFVEGLAITWKPSKHFIREVGKEEALRLAAEMEEKGKITSRSDLPIGGVKQKA